MLLHAINQAALVKSTDKSGNSCNMRVNPSLGPPLETSLFQRVLEEDPLLRTGLCHTESQHHSFRRTAGGEAARTAQRPNLVAFHAPIWHEPERVTVLLSGPYASGMTHPSLHGCTRGVSWKEYCHSVRRTRMNEQTNAHAIVLPNGKSRR